MDNITNFIIIDDEKISTLICEIALINTFPNPKIRKFANPVDALMHIGVEYENSKVKKPTLLFLDLYMPVIDGWEFLKCYDSFDKKIKSQITILVLSSSTDAQDKERALQNIYVSDYIVKPLMQDVLYFTLSKYKRAA